MALLEGAAEVYELYTIALYDLDGPLARGTGGAPENPDGSFLGLLRETDNLTIDFSAIFQDKLDVITGTPVKNNGETPLYVMGIYKYDLLNDVISGINWGRSGMAYMVRR